MYDYPMSLISLSTWSIFLAGWVKGIILSHWGGVGGGPWDFSVSPSPFGLDFGTLDFGLILSFKIHDVNSTWHCTVGKFGGQPYKKSDWSSYLLIGHRGLWLDIISSDWLSWPLIGHHVLWLVISHYVNHIHHVLISFSHSHFLIFSFYIDTRRYCQVTGTGIRDGKWEMGNGK